MRTDPRIRFLVILLVALLPRVGFVLLYGANAPPTDWGDDWHYDRIARQILLEHALSDGWFPPGYPLFLAGIYAVFGPDLAAVRLLQAVIGAATCGIVYLLGRRLYDERVGVVAALLLAFYPPHLYFTWRIMAETAFAFVVAASALLAMRLLTEGPSWPSVLLGISLGVSNLLKSNLFVWPPVLILWLATNLRGRQALKLVGGATVPFLLLVSVVPLANLAAGRGLKAPLPLNAGHTLWWANNPKANGYFVMTDSDPEVQAFIRSQGLAGALSAASRAEKDRIYQRLALVWIRTHPVDFLRLVPHKLLNAFSPFPKAAVFESGGAARLVFVLSYGLLLPFAVYGLARSIRRPNAERQVVHLILVSYVSMVVLFYGTPRFTLVVMPYVSIFAAHTLTAAASLRYSAGNTISLHPAATPIDRPVAARETMLTR